MVITSQTINMRQWTTKFATGFCATGCRMAYNKQRNTADCPWCGYLQETTVHILQCPNLEAQRLWDSAILQLREQLLESDTEPGIIEDLSTGLDAWRKQANPLWLSQTRVGPRRRSHGTTLPMGSYLTYGNHNKQNIIIAKVTLHPHRIGQQTSSEVFSN